MPYLEIRDEPHHRLWRLSRPERHNALGPTLARALGDALAALAAAPAKPRALVLTAAPIVKGSRCTWIAGGDLKELAERPSKSEGHLYALSLSNFLDGLDRLPLPVLVTVDGDAIGGGAELALGGDLRLVTRRTRLIFKQVEIGLATGYGGARRLVELVGLGRAQDLLLGARTVTADEALSLGLVHEVLDDDRALAARVAERTAALAAFAPEALAAQKLMLWSAVRAHPGATRAAEAAIFREAWGNPTHRRFLAGFAAPRLKAEP